MNTPQIREVTASAVASSILSELQKADQIIIAMLNAMTTAQKSKVHARLAAAGISDTGMTRHHERLAAIEAGKTARQLVTTPQAGSLAELEPHEIPVLRCFRAMDDRSQAFIGRLVQKLAEDNPRRVAPKLTLVSGGAA